MVSSPITSWQIEEKKVEAVTDFLFLGSKITADGGCSHEIRWLTLQKKAIINLDGVLKSRHHLANKDLYSQGYGFFSSHVRMWKLDHKEGWVPKDWCFQIVVLEKTLESPTDSKEVKPVHPKRNQPWIFIGRTDAEAPILWPPDAKSQLIGKDPDAGKDWRQKEKRVTEDEMVGWHHQFNGHELGQTLRDVEGQGGLACCSLWGLKELDMTWQLNNNRAEVRQGAPAPDSYFLSIILCSNQTRPGPFL